jgi:serine/threonine-protein kinase
VLLDEPRHPEMLGRLGNYDIEGVLGQGGMGVVYRAFDSQLNRPVAIKVLAPHLASSGTARRRFAREARAAAAVAHPNVIPIHGVSGEGRLPFIVMQLVPGRSLQAMVDQDGPLDTITIVRIAVQIAAGLSAAHQQGLVHRDIKPANILIERDVGRVMISDFGLARAADDAAMTHTGWLAGTPNYMSPEQARGQAVDARSDLFSLGAVMYFMAGGRVPFRADSPVATLHKICHDRPDPLIRLNSSVPRTLERIISRLLEKDPKHRFRSADQLHEVLQQYLAHLQHPEIRSSPPRVGARRSLTNWALAAIVLVGLGLAAAPWMPGLGSSKSGGGATEQSLLNAGSLGPQLQELHETDFESRLKILRTRPGTGDAAQRSLPPWCTVDDIELLQAVGELRVEVEMIATQLERDLMVLPVAPRASPQPAAPGSSASPPDEIPDSSPTENSGVKDSSPPGVNLGGCGRTVPSAYQIVSWMKDDNGKRRVYRFGVVCGGHDGQVRIRTWASTG